MECLKLNCNKRAVSDKNSYSFIRKRRKLTSLKRIYAGLLVFLVPSILCDSDQHKRFKINYSFLTSRRLTYDKIFNSTNYAQIQHKSRPYTHLTYSFSTSLPENNKHLDSEEDTKGNELEYEEYKEKDDNRQLLVGFSHDPFRYSVPEKDYLKGIRNIDPQTYMNKGENRGKRGVVHLYNMMYCATGCEPLAYKGYGCYCGFLGSGRPTDGIDRCCKMHDRCYEDIYCPFFTVYFQPYYWKCYRGEPLCALENYHTRHNFINGCAARLCECDRQFAMCIKNYPCPRRRALCRSSPIRLLQNLLMFK